MYTTTYYYVRPTDSVFIRGNMSFGDAGEHGVSTMPPPPSLFAGAFRSSLLGKDNTRLTEFARRGRVSDPQLHACLGSVDEPGDFAITWLSLAQQTCANTHESVSLLPNDVLMLGDRFSWMEPKLNVAGAISSNALPLSPTLQAAKQEKPKGGIWLSQEGLTRYLLGQDIACEVSIKSEALFKKYMHLGIGINSQSKTVEEGHIYTTEGFSFSPVSTDKMGPLSTGFLIGIQGVADLLPEKGHLRLGGDGRSAEYTKVDFTPPVGALGQKGFRIILQTPGLFTQGWLPDCIEYDGADYRLAGTNFSAKLVCASIGRREVISGWDLFRWQPKPAQAVVPAGSVYWFSDFEGDWQSFEMALMQGWWFGDLDKNQQTRRAEGYNRVLLGTWN